MIRKRQLVGNLFSALLFLPVAAQYHRLYSWYFEGVSGGVCVSLVVKQILHVICVVGVSFLAILITILWNWELSGKKYYFGRATLRWLPLVVAQSGLMGFLIFSHSGGPESLHCGLSGAVLVSGIVLRRKRGVVMRLFMKADPEVIVVVLGGLGIALEVCRWKLHS